MGSLGYRIQQKINKTIKNERIVEQSNLGPRRSYCIVLEWNSRRHGKDNPFTLIENHLFMKLTIVNCKESTHFWLGKMYYKIKLKVGLSLHNLSLY